MVMIRTCYKDYSMEFLSLLFSYILLLYNNNKEIKFYFLYLDIHKYDYKPYVPRTYSLIRYMMHLLASIVLNSYRSVICMYMYGYMFILLHIITLSVDYTDYIKICWKKIIVYFNYKFINCNSLFIYNTCSLKAVLLSFKQVSFCKEKSFNFYHYIINIIYAILLSPILYLIRSCHVNYKYVIDCFHLHEIGQHVYILTSMNDDKPLSAFYASIDISKGKMFYIPRCIRVSSRKIHQKYSITLINSFMIWCTEDCLSTSLEIIEVKPTRKLIELLMLCGCCMLCCPHPCLIICTLMLMQIEDYCVLQMFRHYFLCLCILLVFIYKDVHVLTKVDIVAYRLDVTFYETLLQLLSLLRIYDGLQSFTQSTLIALHVHVPGIFRQVTPHRTKLRSHRENIARYFNESKVMMYLHEIIIYTTGIHAMCPNLFNIPLLTKIRPTLFIHFRNYWYSNKRSNYFKSIYTIILQTFLILLHITPLVDNSNLRRLLYLYMYTCSLVVGICYVIRYRPVCQILIHIYNSSKDNSYRQLLCATFIGHFLYIYNIVTCHYYYLILFHLNAGLARVHLIVTGGILLSLFSKIQIYVLNTYLLTLAVHLNMLDVMKGNRSSNAKYLNIWKLYILYAHSFKVHSYSKNIAITSVKTLQLNTYFIDHNSSLCVNDMLYFLISCAIYKHYHIIKTMVLIITHTIPECILN